MYFYFIQETILLLLFYCQNEIFFHFILQIYKAKTRDKNYECQIFFYYTARYDM